MSSANPVNADVLKSAGSGGFGRPAVRAWSEKSKLHLGADAGLSEDYERREEPENEESAFQIGINRCAEELGFVPTHICVASSPRRHLPKVHALKRRRGGSSSECRPGVGAGG